MILILERMADSVIGDLLLTLVPVAVYWGYAAIYMMLAGPLEKYRLHPKKDADKLNLVSMGTVIKGTLLLQGVQFAMNSILFAIIGKDEAPSTGETSLLTLARQIFVMMVMLDTWEYFIHRIVHYNKFLYRYVHGPHHQLVVPYAFGALYGHPLEGLIDMIGTVAAVLISGMSSTTTIFFFCFASMKVIDDHSGYYLPWHPFHILFENNTVFHDAHHQLNGLKYNFSSTYFVWWDKLLGTYKPISMVKREAGGYEAVYSNECKAN